MLAETVIDYLKRPKENIPPQPQPSKRSAGVLFGNVVAEIYNKILNGYHGDMMKMDILRILYDVKYKSQNRNEHMSPVQVQTRSQYPQYMHSPPPTHRQNYMLSSLDATQHQGSILHNPLLQLGGVNTYLQ